MLELDNAVLATEPEAAVGPARRKRSGTFHQASHRIRTRGAVDRYFERFRLRNTLEMELLIPLKPFSWCLETPEPKPLDILAQTESTGDLNQGSLIQFHATEHEAEHPTLKLPSIF